jgi:hypothetical protein
MHQAGADRHDCIGSLEKQRRFAGMKGSIFPFFGKVSGRQSGFRFISAKISSLRELELLDDDRRGNRDFSHA